MSEAQLTEAAVREVLNGVRDPEIGRGLVELKMIDSVALPGPQAVRVQVALPTHAYPGRERIAGAIQQALAARFPGAQAETAFVVRTQGKDSGGGLGLRAKNVVAVGSGKGGVGKSTVAASLAFGLQTYGAKVGLMDADVYGPSIPHMLGAHGQPQVVEQQTATGQPVRRILPIECSGLKVMSMGFFVPADEAVVWRGPMLHGAITQFLRDTDWGELDYLIIDLPPGTGDVSLTLSQLLGLAGAVVVCTPQQVALLDAVKAVAMFRKVKIPVLGMVENMTGEIFGRGGVQKKAGELGVPFLGEIPIDSQLRINGDEGKLADNFAESNPSRPYLQHVCEQTAMQIAKQLLSEPRMPTLEIL
ncbi:MAG TPA: Mrp/NBP35 family ATP-binding protein [Planctomycetaceae bacterium]|nr:Mrp/NBP35 family ATP-binding protein [Planctomycetaceae bacterium]